MQKKALGKGLEALLPEKLLESSGESPLQEIDLKSIIPNRYQPRRRFDEGELSELADSIRSKGVVEPILVRKADGERYELIAGERRCRAAVLAGCSRIPALVREASDSDLLELALVENLLRKDLNPMEAARAYQRLMQEFGLSQEEVGRRTGKERSSIANALRLLNLPGPLQEDLMAGKITVGHAKVILSLQGAGDQLRLGRRVVRQGLSVRQTERLAKLVQEGVTVRRRPASQAPELAQVQEQLSYRLGTRIRVTGGSGRGRIVIEYYTKTDLERILETILPQPHAGSENFPVG